MKKLFLVLVGVVSIISLKAQSVKIGDSISTSKFVYLELGGAGLFGSVNFDSRFKGSTGLGYRVGIGIIPAIGSTAITFPLGFNYLLGQGKSHFEGEVTASVITDKSVKFSGSSSHNTIFYSPHIGYRYSKPAKSFLFRIYAGGLIYRHRAIPWAGLSFGYTL